MARTTGMVAKGSPPAGDEAEHPQSARPLPALLCSDAERIDQTTQRAEISVIASSEEEAWPKFDFCHLLSFSEGQPPW